MDTEGSPGLFERPHKTAALRTMLGETHLLAKYGTGTEQPGRPHRVTVCDGNRGQRLDREHDALLPTALHGGKERFDEQRPGLVDSTLLKIRKPFVEPSGDERVRHTKLPR